MRARDVEIVPVPSCGPDELLSTAAALMLDSDAGAVAVVGEQGRPIALLTEHDVVLALSRLGRPLRSIAVWQCMPERSGVVSLDDTIPKAAEVARRSGLGRLMVVDRYGRLAGTLTSAEIRRHGARGRLSLLERSVVLHAAFR